MELTIFRFVQEFLTNVLRHSGSKAADIRVTRERESVHVEVEDHGKGISAERMAEIQSRGSGLGLLGMRERVRQFSGDIDIQSNTGTKVSLTLSVPADKRAAAQ